MGDESGILCRFYDKKKDWGLDLVSLETFRDTSNGYLNDDSCEFGVEVYVVEHTGKGESLSIIKNPKNNTFTWEIPNFSRVDEEQLWSKEFTICGHKWYVLFHIYFSELHSRVDRNLLPPGREVFVKYKLRILNQFGNADHEHIASVWFSAANASWGQPMFFSLKDLNNLSKGFLVNNMQYEAFKVMEIMRLLEVINEGTNHQGNRYLRLDSSQRLYSEHVSQGREDYDEPISGEVRENHMVGKTHELLVQGFWLFEEGKEKLRRQSPATIMTIVVDVDRSLKKVQLKRLA
ncbi:hypothetical protein RJ640_012266 [Escallonia rubra]|uniref:MATH domain-containing protein n=1 Tax=Escallonia rubra TaxID=112253 RepID=A0AA88UU74_9ASTE|nr:hypothetical protein RJ640_012266 [Escallonia rubra]